MIVGASAVLVAVVLAVPRVVPNAAGHLGSLVETFRPWLLLAVPALAGLAWWRRSAGAAVAALLPGGDEPHDLVAVQHNISDENPDPAGTVRLLRAAGPDLIGLEEVAPAALPALTTALAADYPHHTVQGTVGLWSRHPLAEA